MTRDGQVLAVEDLTKVFLGNRRARRHDRVRAVNGVSFALDTGRTLGLVGESGCGKTTVARTILGAELPTGGRVLWRGADVGRLDRAELRRYRAAVQAVFQDPSSSLNPRMKVGTLVAEPLRIHRRATGQALTTRVEGLLDAVGLPSRVSGSYPHELSGGMRQRVAIARALALDPEVLVLDEPVSSLDVSVRAQIMNLLKRLQEEFGFACLLIAHDLASVRYLADRIAVMYLGRIVELGPCADVFKRPLHPYTVALTAATLSVTPRPVDQTARLAGEIPSPVSPPAGCPLHTRCPSAFEPCATTRPDLIEVSEGHWAACHLHTSADAPQGVPVAVADRHSRD